MTNKIVTVIIVLVLLGAGGLVFWKYHGGSVKGQGQVQTTSGQPDATSRADQGSASQAQISLNDILNNKVPGCPNGQDVNQTVNGVFKPTMDISNKIAVLDTNFGKIQIQLYDKDAPKTVENFICLIEKGYYNNLTFHRISQGFVIQGGDPNGDGTGGESVYGKTFQDELYPDTASYKAGYLKGVVAMANSGPNTNGSQFFIMLADQPSMPHLYTIFGKVISGMDVVDKIGALPVTPVMGPGDGTPTQKVIINSASIISAK